MKNTIKIWALIFCLLGIGLIMGGSYAYFAVSATSKQQIVMFDTLEITYETGQEILVSNAVPINDESEASSHQFTIRNTNNQALDYNISFVDISLQKDGIDIFSNNLVWQLYKTDSAYQPLELVKEGTFSSLSGFLSGDKELVIKTALHLEAGESQSYCLKIGLFNSTSLQNKDAGMDLSFKIQVDTYDRVEAVSKQSVYHYKEGETPTMTDEQKASVTKIILQNRITPIEGAEASLDFSPNQDGSCMVYLAENQDEAGTYTIYFQGNDEIWLESGKGFFTRFINLREIENIEVLNTSRVTSMNNMFGGCLELTSLDLSSFDTSNVTDMSGMFAQCSKLTNLNISNFDTSKVTRMAWMFENTGLTGIDLSHFDTSQVTDMSGMFCNSKNLKWVDVSSFDTSKVENISQFVDGCINLTNLNLSNFNLLNAKDLLGMFRNCTNLVRLNLDNVILSTGVDAEEVFLGLNPNIYIIVEDIASQETMINLLNGFGITTATVVVAD